MNRPTRQAYAIVGGIALTQLFFGLTLAIFPGWPKVGDWLNNSTAATWAQAVIAGIAIWAGAQAIKRQVQRQAEIEDQRSKAETVRKLQTLSYAVFNLRCQLAVLAEAVGQRQLPDAQMKSVLISSARIQNVPIMDIPTWESNHAIANSLSAIDVLSYKLSQIPGFGGDLHAGKKRMTEIDVARNFVFQAELAIADELRAMGADCPKLHFEFMGRVFVNGSDPKKSTKQ